jgi:hypothetical protein
MAQSSQSAGQCSDYVSQPAGLRKWNAFGRDECDVHESDNLQAPLFAGTGYYECVSGVVQAGDSR